MNLRAKMALLASFVLRPCHWNAQAEEWARLLPSDTPVEHAAVFSELVRSGRCQAFEAVGPDGRVGVIVADVDRAYNPPEFAVRGAFSPETGERLTEHVLPQIEALARQNGCATVGFHTMRPGLLRKAMAQGYGICEVIVRKDVRHVV